MSREHPYSFALLANRARYGVLYGIGLATMFSLFAILAWMFKTPEQLGRLHASLLQVVGSYFVGGVTGGAIIGVAFPLTRWAAPAVILGTVGTFPFFYVLGKFMEPDAPVWPARIAITLIASALFGGSLLLYRTQNQRR